MSNVTVLAANKANAKEVALIKRTVAADTNADEFNIFMNYCRSLQLNPLRRQIYAMVYNKDKPDKRKMSIVIGIDGFRSVAARSGNYRPDDMEPVFEYNDAEKNPANPLGLVKASVKVWQFSHGQWFPVTAAAYWNEYAPQKIQDGKWPSGDPKFRPVREGDPIEGRVVDASGKWGTMGRMMLAKCAEALALRKAWPEDFSNVYSQEEMDRATLDMTGTELAEAGQVEERLERIGGGGRIYIDWLDDRSNEPVEIGKLADRIAEFIEKNGDEKTQIGLFRERNRHALQEFWANAPGDALDIKQMFEKAIAAE